jgi:glutathione synthase
MTKVTKHIFFIDELEKLNLKKDSSLLWALTLQAANQDVYLLFPADFFWSNDDSFSHQLNLFRLEGSINDQFYLRPESIKIKAAGAIKLLPGDQLYMRLDPPMNDHYLNALMLCREWQHYGVKVTNDPLGILKHQEKLSAYRHYPQALASYVGGAGDALFKFMQQQNKQYGVDEFIIKPLNAYSGIGVQKIQLSTYNSIAELKQSIPYSFFVCQPFWKDIAKGEYRSVFWKGAHLGSILKRPKEGDFMANIAQGASFSKAHISSNTRKLCETIVQELFKDGIDLVAFDIMEDKISEVNVTCPGLLVELSHAHGENLITRMI